MGGVGGGERGGNWGCELVIKLYYVLYKHQGLLFTSQSAGLRLSSPAYLIHPGEDLANHSDENKTVKNTHVHTEEEEEECTEEEDTPQNLNHLKKE